MGDLAYCANWVISEDSFFSLCAFPIWLILQPCLGKPEPEVKFSFLLSLHWLTLSMSFCNSLITEAWFSSFDNWEYQTSSLCYLLVYNKILWFNWGCLSYLFSLLSIFLISIKMGCSVQGSEKHRTMIIPFSNLLFVLLYLNSSQWGGRWRMLCDLHF